MAIKSAIEYRGLHPGNTMAQVRRAMKAANISTVERWHAEFLPQHFEIGNEDRYRFRKRSPRYERSKPGLQKKRGLPRYGLSRGVPLVYTGTTYKTATRAIRVTGTSKGARGTIEARALNFHKGLRDELVQTTRHEEAELARHHGAVVTADLEAVNASKVEKA